MNLQNKDILFQAVGGIDVAILQDTEDFLARRKREKEVQAVVDAGIPPIPRPWEPGYREWCRSRAAAEARLERRREVFERIDEREPFSVPDGFPSVVDIVREMRDER